LLAFKRADCLRVNRICGELDGARLRIPNSALGKMNAKRQENA